MIKIFLSYKTTDVLLLPVTPPKLEVDSPWVNQQTASQLPNPLYQSINLIGVAGLHTIQFNSFFPGQGTNYPFNLNTTMWGMDYVHKIKAWRALRYPLRLVIVDAGTRDVNMLVSIDDFKYSRQKDKDVYYTLAMTEVILPKVN